jgi:dienelactone hydrolase
MSRRILAILILSAWLFPALARSAPPEPPRYDHRRLLYWLDERGQERPVASPEDWARRRAAILEGLEAAMGPLPDRTKLEPPTATIGRPEALDGCQRLALELTVAPNERVPAHLYLPPPVQASARRPAVLALHQTTAIGKRDVGEEGRPNRAYGLELAQRGYVVLAPDYPSFGDYPHDFAADGYVSGTMKGIFNHLRCVDYLAARDDVDPERIGVIGHSLGGHNAMFAAAFDPRLKVIVSSCGWTPFHDYYGGKLAGWTSDRYMPRIRDVYGSDPDHVPFDFHEVVAALAPRPFFSNSPLGDDNFDAAGVRKAAAEAGKVYALLGAADNLIIRQPDCGHDFPPAERRAAYGLLDRTFGHTAAREVPAE